MNPTQVDDDARERFLAHFLVAQPSLRSYVQALVGPESDADDLVQEISLTLWRQYALYDPKRPFIAWAIGVARNLVARYRRDHAVRRRRFSPQAEEALSVAFVELEDELQDRRTVLRTCLEHLGSHARELLQMRYQSGMELSAIAAERASSVNAVNKALGKIRRLLLECTSRAEAVS